MKRGRVSLFQNHHTLTVDSGNFAITRSNTPLRIEFFPDSQGVSEMLFLSIPTLLMNSQIPEDWPASNLPLSVDSEHCRPAGDILEILVRERDSLLHETANHLTAAFLNEIRAMVAESIGTVPRRISAADQRFESVCAYLKLNYMNPALNLNMTAQACRISPRYMCELFSRHGISFSDYLWDIRLTKVREYLANKGNKRVAIGVLAYRVGFKSSAHLSQMFRRKFGCAPRDYRSHAEAG